VGLIVVEIGLGLRYLALIHILGHACLRTLQFVRAPTLLHDYRTMENALGTRLPQTQGFSDHLSSVRIRTWLYRLALERGYLDAWLIDYLVNPILGFFRACDSLERRWIAFLSGTEPRPRDVPPPPLQSAEKRL
jgi:NAD(P)H-quinone oxidoreductase subunit 5